MTTPPCCRPRKRLPARLVLLLVLLLFLLPSACIAGARSVAAQDDRAQAAAVPLVDYVAALRAADALLADPANPTALAEARAVLAPITAVTLPGGAELTVTPLLGAADEELDPAAAAVRVTTALAQLEAAAGDDTAARLALLAGVLASPAFQTTESPLAALLRWLAEWLDRFLPDPPPAPANGTIANRTGDVVAWLAGSLGAVALVLLLAYWLRGLLRNFVANAEAPGSTDGDALPQTPAEARRQAGAAAGAGDYRGAVRSLYLAALLTLEDHGLVPADRSLTNREVLSRLDAAHPVRPHLGAVVDTFDDVWYGVHEPDAHVYQEYTQAIDQLQVLAETGDATGKSTGKSTGASLPSRGGRP